MYDAWSVDDCIACWEKMVSFVEEEWLHFAICMMHGMSTITCHVKKERFIPWYICSSDCTAKWERGNASVHASALPCV